MEISRIRERVICALIVLIWLLFIGIVQQPCYSDEYFNYYCTGCGGTRMVLSILSGDFYQAFRYNAYCFVFIPPTALLLVIDTFKPINWLMTYLKIIVTIGIIFTILRNTSTFGFLAPIDI